MRPKLPTTTIHRFRPLATCTYLQTSHATPDVINVVAARPQISLRLRLTGRDSGRIGRYTAETALSMADNIHSGHPHRYEMTEQSGDHRSTMPSSHQQACSTGRCIFRHRKEISTNPKTLLATLDRSAANIPRCKSLPPVASAWSCRSPRDRGVNNRYG